MLPQVAACQGKIKPVAALSAIVPPRFYPA